MKHIVREGAVSLSVHTNPKISKELPVFYNPVMALNRDLSVLLLKALGRKGMRIADPLAGSGVRGTRFLVELPASMIKQLAMNDASPEAVKLINENLDLNNLSASEKVRVHIGEASKFLLGLDGFDYIDVDPFGSPNPFLDAAIRKLARKGVLAVTATDTGALCGTYPKAGYRKYWARPMKGPIMHETGMRILIRKAQLVGMQYDKALLPLLSYSKEHYMRVFFLCEKSRKACDDIARNHGMMGEAGPLWLGRLWDKNLLREMLTMSREYAPIKEDKAKSQFLETVTEEAVVDSVGFFDLHALSKQEKLTQIPPKEKIKELLQKAGHTVSDTHFTGKGIRTAASQDKVVSVMKALSKKL